MSTDTNQLDPQEAERLMTYVLEHYIKHYDAVMRKMGHARTATSKSIAEIDEADDSSSYKELSEIQGYEVMWDKVIKLYSNSGVSEEELEKIDSILSGMPRIIKKYYEVLVKQDHVLQTLLAELECEEYKEAIQVTRKVQSQPNKMSGLSVCAYDINQVHESALMFKVYSTTRN